MNENPTQVKRPLESIDRFAFHLSRMLHNLAACFLAMIVVLNIVNVIGRYVFGKPLESADELMGFLLTVAIFLTFPRSTYEDGHIRMDLMLRLLNLVWRARLNALVNILLLGIYMLIMYKGIPIIIKLFSWGQVSDVVKIPMWIPHSAIPICFGLAGLILAIKIICRTPQGENK